MRSRIKIVKDPMIIRAEIIEYRYSSSEQQGTDTITKRLRIKISTDKIETTLALDLNKDRDNPNVNLYAKKKLRFSFTKKPVCVSFTIRCHKNRRTKYKDFLYLLRNPHSALLFLKSDNRRLKLIAEAIIQGKRIIFPRETRYYGNISRT